MADHLITGTLTYVVVTCGNLACRKPWEQPNTPLDDPGWNVCPECMWSAPTNVARALRERGVEGAPADPKTTEDSSGH